MSKLATGLMPAIKLEDYSIDDVKDDAELIERLKDPLFRICNIYKVKDKDGNEVKFIPNYPQRVVLHHVYNLGWQRLLIPKARQLGFSTLFAIICLDETHFNDGMQASIIDQTIADAREKLKKVGFSYENLPRGMKDYAKVQNSVELEFMNGSRVCAGMKARGGTNQVLHVSEWGPIAFNDAKRSREIITGAFPSVSGRTGKIFCESTHMGGKGGDWYDHIQTALAISDENRTEKDFRVLFFPWWMDNNYRTEGNYEQIDSETTKYFIQLEREYGIKLDQQQRLFYFKAKQSLKRDIFREFPSVIDECWKAPTPGMIYSHEIDKARSSRRISDNVRHYDGFPVYTAWDIGAPENTKLWIYQVIGDTFKFLESLTGSDDCATPSAWVKRLKEKKYCYGSHFLPHDGEILWQRQLSEAGLEAVQIVPRQMNIWDGINDTLAALPRCEFNVEGCKHGISALEAYRSKIENDGQSIRDVPVHDWASHYSSAFAIAHQAVRHGMLRDRSAMPRKPISQYNEENGGAVKAKIGLSTQFNRVITVRR